MQFVAITMAAVRIDEVEVDSKPQNRAGVITVSIADTQPVLSLAAQ
jgi:hypothetical protein